MFDDWKLRRLLKRKFPAVRNNKLYKEIDEDLLEYHTLSTQEFSAMRAEQTKKLIRRAHDYAIDFPNEWLFEFEDGGRKYVFLTDEGKRKLHRLVREKSRESAEWWVKLVITVLTALTGLIGSIIGLVAMIR